MFRQFSSPARREEGRAARGDGRDGIAEPRLNSNSSGLACALARAAANYRLVGGQ